MKHYRTRLLTIVLLFAIGDLLTVSQFAFAEEFESLFNGTDLEGWVGNSEIWTVEDGAITGTTTVEKPLKHNTFLIYQGKPLGNFQLELEYRIDGGNSGIQYRSKVIDPKKWIVGGYQADLEAGTTYSGILYEEKGRGILAERGQRSVISANGKKETTTFADTDELQKHIHSNDWNDYVVEAQGNALKHSINGHLMSETVDREKGKRADQGVLALQVHTGPPMKIQFRNVRLKRLDE